MSEIFPETTPAADPRPASMTQPVDFDDEPDATQPSVAASSKNEWASVLRWALVCALIAWFLYLRLAP